MIPNKIFKDIFYFINDIKIHHILFSFPFVFASIFIADIKLTITQISVIILCLILSRNWAMAINRILDKKIDFLNKRTKNRALPSKKIDIKIYFFWSFISALGFVISSYNLNNLSGNLSFLILILFGLYPLLKRLTIFTHYYLGFCIGLLPLAISVASGSEIYLNLILLTISISFWIAGFDIIYSIQDKDFDIDNNLFSVPSYFGIKYSIYISQINFMISLFAMIYLGIISDMSFLYYIGVFFVFLLFIYQYFKLNQLIEDGKGNLNYIFFNLNVYISLIYMAFTIIDRLYIY